MTSYAKTTLRILALTLPLACLAGCGGSTPAAPTPVFPNVTGNWQFEVRILVPAPPNPPSPVSIPVGVVFGSLTSSGGKVTGILNVRPSEPNACVANNADLAVTGTVDAAGNLSLTGPIAGGVQTITAAIESQPLSLSATNGTYQVVGGPCAQAPTTIIAFHVLDAGGTYMGTMTQRIPAGSGSLTVKAVLAESATPDADGEFPLTGTVTYSGDCTGTLSFTNGVVFGEQLQSGPLSPNFSTSIQLFSAGVPLVPSQPMTASFFKPTGCTGVSYVGNLTRQ